MLKGFVKDRLGYDRRYAIDDAKIRSHLGYRPTKDFREGFADTLQWYLGRDEFF